MFAFALWERDSGRVVLARDRLGIKPLYYIDHPDYFRFASDLLEQSAQHVELYARMGDQLGTAIKP